MVSHSIYGSSWRCLWFRSAPLNLEYVPRTSSRHFIGIKTDSGINHKRIIHLLTHCSIHTENICCLPQAVSPHTVCSLSYTLDLNISTALNFPWISHTHTHYEQELHNNVKTCQRSLVPNRWSYQVKYLWKSLSVKCVVFWATWQWPSCWESVWQCDGSM